MNPRYLAILLLYLGLSCYQLNLPGLHYDEAFEAVPALQLWQGTPVTAFRQSGIHYNGQIFPTMTQDYIGAINSYSAIPFIALLGPTPTALRLMAVLMGLLTLGATYLLVSYLTNEWGGLISMALLSVDPTFIFWNRQGVFVTAITAAIGVAATYACLRRLREGDLRWTLMGAFLLGFGLYAKFLFLWLIAALGLCLGLYFLATHREIKRTSLKEILLAMGAFIVGCLPLILYNLDTQGTYLAITQNAGTSYYGVDNLAFSTNLGTRLYQYTILLNGGHLWYLGAIVQNPLPPLLFGLNLLLILALTALRLFTRRGLSEANLMALFPLLMIGLVILASIATVSALWVTHFAILMPWWAIALTLGGWFIYHETAPYLNGFSRTASLILGMTVLLLSNTVSTVSYHQALHESGGLSSHSDAIYDLATWFAERADHPVAAMDWGLAAPIFYLTNGQVQPVELFGYQWDTDAELQQRFAQFVNQPETYYLWRAPDEIIFDRSEPFKGYYRPLGLEENIEEAFYERSGRPLLGVTRLMEQGTAPHPP